MCRNSYSPPFDSMVIPRYAGDYTFLLLFKVVSEEYSRREASCIFVVLHQFSGTTCEVKYTDAVSQVIVTVTFDCSDVYITVFRIYRKVIVSHCGILYVITDFSQLFGLILREIMEIDSSAVVTKINAVTFGADCRSGSPAG